MAQYWTNQDRALQSVELAVYIIRPKVRKAEQETEIQNKDLVRELRDWFNTQTHISKLLWVQASTHLREPKRLVDQN